MHGLDRRLQVPGSPYLLYLVMLLAGNEVVKSGYCNRGGSRDHAVDQDRLWCVSRLSTAWGSAAISLSQCATMSFAS